MLGTKPNRTNYSEYQNDGAVVSTARLVNDADIGDALHQFAGGKLSLKLAGYEVCFQQVEKFVIALLAGHIGSLSKMAREWSGRSLLEHKPIYCHFLDHMIVDRYSRAVEMEFE